MSLMHIAASWIAGFLLKYNRLVRDVTADMDNYEHMKAVKKITEFVSKIS